MQPCNFRGQSVGIQVEADGSTPQHPQSTVLKTTREPLMADSDISDSLTDKDAIMQACRLAHSCVPVARAFNVGAVLTDGAGRLLTTGFSRELPGNTHAEECCLLKLEAGEL